MPLRVQSRNGDVVVVEEGTLVFGPTADSGRSLRRGTRHGAFRFALTRRATHAEGVFDLEYAAHFARTHFGQPAVHFVVDDAEQHRPAVPHDDVNRIAPDRLHAWKVPLVAQLSQY